MRTVEDICAYYEEKIAPEMTIVEEYFESIRRLKQRILLTGIGIFPVLAVLVFLNMLHWLVMAISIPVIALACVWVYKGIFASDSEAEKPVFFQQKVFPIYGVFVLAIILVYSAVIGWVHWLTLLVVLPLGYFSIWLFQNMGTISDDSDALKGSIIKKLINYLNPTHGHKTTSFVDSTLKKLVEKDYNFRLMSIGSLGYEEFEASRLFPLRADLCDSFFYTTGKLQGRGIKFAEMHVAQENGSDIFKGLFFVGQMPSPALASMVCMPSNTQQVFSKLGKNIMQHNFLRGEMVEIPNEALARKYVIYADSPDLTGSMLPISLIALCDETSKKIGLPIMFSLVGEKLYVAIQTDDLLKYADMETLKSESPENPNTVIKDFFIHVTSGVQILTSQLVV
ncbi:MAG: DUF3137 domain-containing protein [Cytophagales bacterium]|nr:MAG: DUF3137 domain-containing protein [Cytophagales bacterium]TAF62149.1 MAG: DUF3137 domain-containing protein [Cytophagales bacterium]